MKKNYFVLLVACLFLVKGIAQQVEQQQRSLVVKRTADWCPYCGTWGWNYFAGAITQNGDKAVYMAAHYDGDLATDAGEEITDNFGGFYQPKFFFNELEQGVNSSNGTAKLEALKTLVDAAYEQAPVVNSGFEPYYENGQIKVGAKVKFFQAAQGEYQLGIYLLEDNVTAYQASIGNNAVHKRLFRASFTPETYGKPIINGSATAGQEIDIDFALTTENPAEHEYEVVGIIWKKNGDKFVPVNVWSTTEISSALSGGVVVPTATAMVIAPSVAADKASITVQSIENHPVATIDVLDVNGKIVATLHKGFLKKQQATFSLERSQVGRSGLYFVRLTTPGFTLVEKVVFQ